MTENMTENQRERARNKELFKKMSSKEKLNYIWHYYRWHITGTILVVIFAISVISVMLEAQGADIYSTDVVMLGLVFTDERYEEQLQQFQETMDVNINILQTATSGDPEMVMANELLFMVSLIDNKADIMFLTQQKYETLVTDGEVFTPLNDIVELNEVFNLYELQTYNEDVYGIKLTTSPIDGIKFGEDLIVCISGHPKDLEHTVNTLNYLLEK
ncbi:MAG: hypothetical protein ATN33_02405 [Epulopiscium sp. Nele67-Bin001]|nr:MAG: hypothetical protein ATN33_02405 [Epulopiscium sp. Nele67-Bin001]